MENVIDGIYDPKNPLSSVATYAAPEKGTVTVYVSYALHATRNDDGSPAMTVAEQVLDAFIPGSPAPEQIRHSAATISCTINDVEEWRVKDYEFSDLRWKWSKDIPVVSGDRVIARVDRSNAWADPVPGGDENRDEHGLAFRLLFEPFHVDLVGKVNWKF